MARSLPLLPAWKMALMSSLVRPLVLKDSEKRRVNSVKIPVAGKRNFERKKDRADELFFISEFNLVHFCVSSIILQTEPFLEQAYS